MKFEPCIGFEVYLNPNQPAKMGVEPWRAIVWSLPWHYDILTYKTTIICHKLRQNLDIYCDTIYIFVDNSLTSNLTVFADNKFWHILRHVFWHIVIQIQVLWINYCDVFLNPDIHSQICRQIFRHVFCQGFWHMYWHIRWHIIGEWDRPKRCLAFPLLRKVKLKGSPPGSYLSWSSGGLRR